MSYAYKFSINKTTSVPIPIVHILENGISVKTISIASAESLEEYQKIAEDHVKAYDKEKKSIAQKEQEKQDKIDAIDVLLPKGEIVVEVS